MLCVHDDILTTSRAANDENVANMTTYMFHEMKENFWIGDWTVDWIIRTDCRFDWKSKKKKRCATNTTR